MNPYRSTIFWFLASFFFVSCAKETIITNNDAPNYNEVSTLLIENYVNRVYIDFIGREPLDSEMVLEVGKLKAADLAFDARRKMIENLQTDTSFIEGDSSYRRAYYHRMYNLSKARVIEGASNSEINQKMGIIKAQMKQDSINGNWAAYDENKRKVEKYQKVLDCDHEFEQGLIYIDSVFARMINNGIYDFINMNSFNFVNASFDNLLYRFPTGDEFNRAYNVIEYNQTELIFGQGASNKDEYIQAMVASSNFHEGIIMWLYQNLLQRFPNSAETAHHLDYFSQTRDLQEVQVQIAISDEYAGFD